MKTLIDTILVILILNISPALAENRPSNTEMKADQDGKIEADEYRLISANGGLTRRPCPYTCEMRGIPRENCKEFKSTDGSECYVEDKRLSQNAVNVR